MAGWKGGHKKFCKALAYREALGGMVHLMPKERGSINLNMSDIYHAAFSKGNTVEMSAHNVPALKKQVAVTWTVCDQPGK